MNKITFVLLLLLFCFKVSILDIKVRESSRQFTSMAVDRHQMGPFTTDPFTLFGDDDVDPNPLLNTIKLKYYIHHLSNLSIYNKYPLFLI